MPRAIINGVDIHYEVYGVGFDVVLIHGYARSHQDWAAQIPLLAETYRVTVFDLPGHGSSSAPPAVEAYSIGKLGRDVTGLVDWCGIRRCCIVGHSMGGMVALDFALNNPEKTAGLVLVDTSSEVRAPEAFRKALDGLDRIAVEQGLAAAFELDLKSAPTMQKRFEKYPRLLECNRRQVSETSVAGYTGARRAFASWTGVRERLGEIKVPSLVIVGEDDAPIKPSSEELASGIAGAKFEVMPGVGHYPHQDSAEAFNRHLLEFLARLWN
jgi:pimeloyl-ACP methyl ester carboxylesterase